MKILLQQAVEMPPVFDVMKLLNLIGFPTIAAGKLVNDMTKAYGDKDNTLNSQTAVFKLQNGRWCVACTASGTKVTGSNGAPMFWVDFPSTGWIAFDNNTNGISLKPDGSFSLTRDNSGISRGVMDSINDTGTSYQMMLYEDFIQLTTGTSYMILNGSDIHIVANGQINVSASGGMYVNGKKVGG